jgi:hypothetical protein
MGKKSKKGAFDGDSVYDYLKRDFDPQGYGSLDRMSDEVRNRKANDDFQRYLLTGEKRGPDWNPVTGNLPRNQKKSKVDKLFEAGIPPSQFKYYAETAKAISKRLLKPTMQMSAIKANRSKKEEKSLLHHQQHKTLKISTWTK